MAQSVMKPPKTEIPKSVSDNDLWSSLQGFKPIGVVTPEYNCCVQKVIGELAPYFKNLGMAPVMGFDEDPKKLIDAAPDWIVYLRAGVKVQEPIQWLANLDGYIGFFRSLGLPVYYYLDDALFFINNSAPLKLIWNVDKAIVATDALAEFLLENQKYPKPVHIIKTHMDIPTFDRCGQPLYLVEPDKFNILFTSQGRIGALMIHRIMERMDAQPDKYKNVNFVVVSAWVAQMRTILNKFRNVRKKYWEWMPLEEHYGLSKSVQLILAPGEEADLEGQVEKEVQHFWLHAKSCVKYTLAGAARIPIISSPLNEYEKAIKHGETGFLADTLDKWMEYIDLCISDEDLCAKIGAAARKDVEENWHIKTRAQEWHDTLHGKDTTLVKGIVKNEPAESYNLRAEPQLSPERISSSLPGVCGVPGVPESGDPGN